MNMKSMGMAFHGVSLAFSLLLVILLSGCQKEDANLSPEGETDMSIQVSSSAFSEAGNIPRLYTCDDINVSPPLTWTGVPDNAMSLALIMDDPDAPAGTWVHWVLFNLPPALSSLEQGISGGGTEGRNDFGRSGYEGPCPPRGSNHRYLIKMYALDIVVDLKAGASKSQLENQMRGHILAQGQLMGKYGR
jgi:Raf kinase inhibitor-like YbhB/YbcL family protein